MVIFRSWTINGNIFEAVVCVPDMSNVDFLIKYNMKTDEHWFPPEIPGVMGRTANKAVYAVLKRYKKGKLSLGARTEVVWG